MNHPAILLFRTHAHDPLSQVIQEVTRTDYTHAAILINSDTNEISEAYVPHVRSRFLADNELAGIDVFACDMTDEQASGILNYCAEAQAQHEPYDIFNLLRFNPLLREVLGEATDTSFKSPVICSQYDLDAFERGAGIKLLNAPSYKVAPGVVAWSPLLKQQPPLQPVSKTVTASTL